MPQFRQTAADAEDTVEFHVVQCLIRDEIELGVTHVAMDPAEGCLWPGAGEFDVRFGLDDREGGGQIPRQQDSPGAAFPLREAGLDGQFSIAEQFAGDRLHLLVTGGIILEAGGLVGPRGGDNDGAGLGQIAHLA